MSDDAGKIAQARVESASEAETIALGARLGAALEPGAWIALSGELGAGKTRFVRGLARGVGANENRVASPTFVLLRVYESAAGGAALAHLDAYRMADAGELDTLGLDALLAERDAIVAVEWAERIAEAVPESALRVRLEHAEDGEECRRIALEGRADVWGEILAELDADLARRKARASASACPVCGGPAPKGAATHPFCSPRCRLVDLGKWMREDYRISRPAAERDLDEGE